MAEETSIEARVREIAERAAAERGLELVHAEVAGGARTPIVRLFIDKEGGVTHEDCSEVSRHVGTVFDVEDFIPGAYTLEVSSPGLERPLRWPDHWRRFIGRQVRVRAESLPGRNQYEIVSVPDDDHVVLRQSDGATLTVAFDAVREANLVAEVAIGKRR